MRDQGRDVQSLSLLSQFLQVDMFTRMQERYAIISVSLINMVIARK